MPALEIVQATIQNTEEAAALFNEYRVFYSQESDIEGARQFMFERISNMESVIFLVVDHAEQRAVGFTQLYPSFSSVSMKRVWILNDLYILEPYRGQGAARLLLEAAKQFAILKKSKGIELSTAMDNYVAQGLYERSGYKRDVEYHHYFLSL